MSITFAFGNHTFETFTDRVKASEYLNELWDEESQERLLNLVQVDIEREGVTKRVERFPYNGTELSLGAFVSLIEDELL